MKYYSKFVFLFYFVIFRMSEINLPSRKRPGVVDISEIPEKHDKKEKFKSKPNEFMVKSPKICNKKSISELDVTSFNPNSSRLSETDTTVINFDTRCNFLSKSMQSESCNTRDETKKRFCSQEFCGFVTYEKSNAMSTHRSKLAQLKEDLNNKSCFNPVKSSVNMNKPESPNSDLQASKLIITNISQQQKTEIINNITKQTSILYLERLNLINNKVIERIKLSVFPPEEALETNKANLIINPDLQNNREQILNAYDEQTVNQHKNHGVKQEKLSVAKDTSHSKTNTARVNNNVNLSVPKPLISTTGISSASRSPIQTTSSNSINVKKADKKRIINHSLMGKRVPYNFSANLNIKEYKHNLPRLLNMILKAEKNEITKPHEDFLMTDNYINSVNNFEHHNCSKNENIGIDQNEMVIKLTENLKGIFFDIFLCPKFDSDTNLHLKLQEKYQTKKTSAIYFVFFIDLLKLLNIMNEELIDVKIKKRYEKIENWQEIYIYKTQFLIREFIKFENDLNNFFISVKTTAQVFSDNHNHDLNVFINLIIDANIENYRSILIYFMQIYKWIYNVEETDFKIFQLIEIKKKSTFAKQSCDTCKKTIFNTICTSKNIDNDNTIEKKSEIESKKDLITLHFLDYQILYLTENNHLKHLSTSTNVHNNNNQPYFIALKKNFIESRFFFALLNENFCAQLNLRFYNLVKSKVDFQFFFNKKMSSTSLYRENFFKDIFFENAKSYEILFLSMIDKSVENKINEKGIQKTIRNKTARNNGFFIYELGSQRVFSTSNVQNIGYNFLVKLLLDHYDTREVDSN